VKPSLYKLAAFDTEGSEAVFQRYRFELGDWTAVTPDLNLQRLTRLVLTFDDTPRGSLLVDDIVISRQGL